MYSRPTVGIRIEVLNTDNSSLLVTLSPDIVVGKESVVNVSVTKGDPPIYNRASTGVYWSNVYYTNNGSPCIKFKTSGFNLTVIESPLPFPKLLRLFKDDDLFYSTVYELVQKIKGVEQYKAPGLFLTTVKDKLKGVLTTTITNVPKDTAGTYGCEVEFYNGTRCFN
ncbi:unnamed protein product [Oppiella nova]|uniref:Uncharacterized protein n=1 Tax=Oppiella nova TaxID=334625 RepID=A0A7R9M0V3_9ACAR|nr:unnamed protein product [Oppiella nova]CAG2168863.1 unnamed protein product [Oppiella nova]